MNADRERKEQLIRNQRRMMLLKARRPSAAPVALATHVVVAPEVLVVQNKVNKSSYHPSVAMLQKGSHLESTEKETTPTLTINNRKSSVEGNQETTHAMIEEIHNNMKRSVADTEQRMKVTAHAMIEENLNNVKKRLDETEQRFQSIEPTLQSSTHNMNKVHLQLDGLRQDVGTMKQQIYTILQTLSGEKPVTHIFFYAIANKAVPVYDDNKEEVSDYSVEIHEKVLLNYPMIKENKKIWIQIRRIGENGEVRMFWVKFFSENHMNFENVSFY